MTNKIPKALIASIIILVFFEFLLRVIPQSWLYGYGDGVGSYCEIRQHIESVGAADISVIGTSRGRECMIIPDLRARLTSELQKPISVRNYSCFGARASETFFIVKYLLQNRQQPEIILYILSPRVFLGNYVRIERQQLLWDQNDWKQYFKNKSDTNCWDYIKLDIDTVLEKELKLYRYRYRFRNLLEGMIFGRYYTSSVNGELTELQKYKPFMTMQSNNITDKVVKKYVKRLLDGNGDYVYGQKNITALNKIIEMCNDNNVKIILLEAPITCVLKNNYPKGTYPKFISLMERISNQYEVEFITLYALGIKLNPNDFRDQSHVNLNGAQKVTHAVAGKILIPYLKKQRVK